VKRSRPAGRILARNAALVLLALCLALSGCAVKFIGDYDDVIDRGVTDFQQAAATYLSQLETQPNTPYRQAFYDDAHGRLAALRSRAAASDKKEILVEQIDELRKSLDQLQKGDQLGRPIPVAFVTIAQSTIAVHVESILKLELALKRGRPTRQ
jgi:hypothetical protein